MPRVYPRQTDNGWQSGGRHLTPQIKCGLMLRVQHLRALVIVRFVEGLTS